MTVRVEPNEDMICGHRQLALDAIQISWSRNQGAMIVAVANADILCGGLDIIGVIGLGGESHCSAVVVQGGMLSEEMQNIV